LNHHVLFISRASIVSTKSSTNINGYYPQHTVYCIEYFRNELVKSIYLLSSLTFSKDIPIATLNAIIVQPNPEDIQLDEQDMSLFQIIQLIKKFSSLCLFYFLITKIYFRCRDINQLEEYIYTLNQRYYTHLPDWHNLGNQISSLSCLSLNLFVCLLKMNRW